MLRERHLLGLMDIKTRDLYAKQYKVWRATNLASIYEFPCGKIFKFFAFNFYYCLITIFLCY